MSHRTTLGLRLVPYALPMARPVVTARGRVVERRGVLVLITDADGRRGFGEIAPWEGFGSPTAEIDRALTAVARWILPVDLAALDSEAAVAHIDALVNALGLAREVEAGLSTALLDLAAQRRGKSIAALFSDTPRRSLTVGALVVTAEDASRRVHEGYRTLKAKLGAAAPNDDLERVRALRAAVGPDVSLRLDANRAWDEPTAHRVCAGLAALHPEFVEEPLANPTPEAWVRLRAATGVPLAVDEGLTQTNPERWLDPAVCDVAVLKTGLVGGPCRAIDLAERAFTAGLAVTVGSAFETAIGRAAAMQVAAALGVERACGLGGMLERDVATLPPVRTGEIVLPLAAGLGVTVNLSNPGVEAP